MAHLDQKFFLTLTVGEIIHVFIAFVITIQMSSTHFTAKIKSNDHFWFKYHSLKRPCLKMEKLGYLDLQKVGLVAYVKKSFTNLQESPNTPNILSKPEQPDIDYREHPASSHESSPKKSTA